MTKPKIFALSFVISLFLSFTFWIVMARADPLPTPCEHQVRLRLSQTHYTLSIGEHLKDRLNAVEFQLPLSCQFADQINVGDDLLTKSFRWGSLVKNGSLGTWNLRVVSK